MPLAGTCVQSIAGSGRLAAKAAFRENGFLIEPGMIAAHEFMRTGKLAAVMKPIGLRDVNTAMHYQHPELKLSPLHPLFERPLPVRGLRQQWSPCTIVAGVCR